MMVLLGSERAPSVSLGTVSANRVSYSEHRPSFKESRMTVCVTSPWEHPAVSPVCPAPRQRGTHCHGLWLGTGTSHVTPLGEGSRTPKPTFL